MLRSRIAVIHMYDYNSNICILRTMWTNDDLLPIFVRTIIMHFTFPTIYKFSVRLLSVPNCSSLTAIHTAITCMIIMRRFVTCSMCERVCAPVDFEPGGSNENMNKLRIAA